MSWLKTLWSWLIRKTSKTLDNTKIEEEINPTESVTVGGESATQILVRVLLSRGVNIREISIMKLESLFENWYDGPATEQAVLEALPEFKKRYGISFADEK